jgi:hypothetical protein
MKQIGLSAIAIPKFKTIGLGTHHLRYWSPVDFEQNLTWFVMADLARCCKALPDKHNPFFDVDADCAWGIQADSRKTLLIEASATLHRIARVDKSRQLDMVRLTISMVLNGV